jgi:two-component system CheB/CheR fusion protein
VRHRLGLGLALAKGLIELHGGGIGAHSDGAGRGSELVITLPLVEPPRQAQSVSVAMERPPPRARRILIIEDDIDAAQLLAEALRMEGHEVRLARNGTTGLAMAREVKPDVVLCDIGLPGLDGYEVARVLRADESFRSTRLVALTGYAQPEDKERAKEAGFDAHLAKPSPIGDVTSALT